MRIILVRHGESVDNTRANSVETINVTHIFSSDLQRASATASAISDALSTRDGDRIVQNQAPAVSVQTADLRERDFRSGEGTRFGSTRSAASGGRNAFSDAESWNEMGVRARRFIDEHLDRLLVEAREEEDEARAIVVVAHGLILNVLLTSLLLRYTPSELTRLQPSVLPESSRNQSKSQLRVPWSNTGHLVIRVTRIKPTLPSSATDLTTDTEHDVFDVKLRVVAINCTEHLEGLKKTRGSIGSLQFDPKQKTIDAFFGPSTKRQKRGGDA
ncbi:hypothetical protein SEPCBS119000_005803 [Sporothrix epigloea]|uniref:Phosphoglycerate mutase family protein n=1 Tax=Sporothrix epigloea TaxID=1892477 RepID=A0ABP0DZK5_9PEZI